MRLLYNVWIGTTHVGLVFAEWPGEPVTTPEGRLTLFFEPVTPERGRIVAF
jgi:hypothetical protein